MEGRVGRPGQHVTDLLAVATLTLATVSPDGAPHAAPVYFAAGAGWQVYFFSDPHSQHSQDLAREARSAIAIYPECTDWRDIRGLQMRGEARPVVDRAEWEQGWAAYRAKFPFVVQLEQIVAQNQMYVFTPTWVRLVDNRRGFGFKEEWSLL